MPAQDYAPVTIANVITGEQTTRALTPQEVADRDAQRAAAEIEITARDTALAAVLADLSPVASSQITAALAQIATEQTAITNGQAAITADLTALAAAATLAQVKPLMQNLLQRQNTMLTGMSNQRDREAKIIKALARLADKV